MNELLPALSEADRDLHELVVEAASAETVMDLREVEFDDDAYAYSEVA
nr:hypothetical protein [Actinoplanes polyasparticus]